MARNENLDLLDDGQFYCLSGMIQVFDDLEEVLSI